MTSSSVSKPSAFKPFVAAALLLAAAAPFAARADGNSIVTTDQARSWAALQGMKAMEVMHAMDAAKKGYVTREEFMKFQEAFFQRMDRNGDGKLDAQEWMGEAAEGGARK
jgi:hypothetical protein